MFLDIRDRVADGSDLFSVLIRDLDIESLLELHDQLYSVEGLSAKRFPRSGILPFTFANEADYDRIDQMDQLELADIRTAMENNTPVVLKNLTKNEEYPLDASHLSARQRAMLLCGGLLDYTRESNK